jgi:hypothetical protein
MTRASALSAAWKHAKLVEAMWGRMTEQERTRALADMRRWRHVLDRWTA